MKPGTDVWVDLDGREWAREVLMKSGGFLVCRIHVDDPAWDFGRSSSRVDPEQIVAVRSAYVRPRVTGPGSIEEEADAIEDVIDAAWEANS